MTGALLACLSAVATAAAPSPGWLKGQTHAHTGNSPDSRTPPVAAARWYAARGFDFVVFTDHDAVTRLPAGVAGNLLVLPGAELTQNLVDCDPSPPPGLRCLLHVNALVVGDAAPPRITWPLAPPHARRVDLYQRALDTARAMGGLAQLNHPNFHRAVDAPLLVELVRRGVVLLEIANEGHDSGNAGDATWPSTEALWDAALSAGATVWGVASDDAHHYDDAADAAARGERPYTGDRGFIFVRARRDAASIRDALRRGDFYASTGVRLRDVCVEGGVLAIDVEGGDAPVETTFIGLGGRVLARATGSRPRFRLADAPRARASYVRAVVRDARGRTAWTQPVPAVTGTADRSGRR